MPYTIKQVAQLSGVSTRTLRYYDEINLLKPAYINDSGYRIYETKEIDTLQQILFYRSLSMKLENIQKIIHTSEYEPQNALKKHYEELLKKRTEIDQLLITIEKTLHYHKGELVMSDQEKFIGFKQEKLNENEKEYGTEIRKKYGEKVIDQTNNQWMNLSKGEILEMEEAEQILFEALKKVIEEKDLHSEDAKSVFLSHKKWLQIIYPAYSSAYHLHLAQMYTSDERFTEYYDSKAGEGATNTLSKIIEHYC